MRIDGINWGWWNQQMEIDGIKDKIQYHLISEFYWIKHSTIGSPKNYWIKYSTLDFHHNGELESEDTWATTTITILSPLSVINALDYWGVTKCKIHRVSKP
jgi:hypothetical protein